MSENLALETWKFPSRAQGEGESTVKFDVAILKLCYCEIKPCGKPSNLTCSFLVSIYQQKCIKVKLIKLISDSKWVIKNIKVEIEHSSIIYWHEITFPFYFADLNLFRLKIDILCDNLFCLHFSSGIFGHLWWRIFSLSLSLFIFLSNYK